MLNEIDTLNQLLNADMSQVSTDFPVLTAGTKELVISEIKVNESKKNAGGKTLELILKTTFPDTFKSGKPANPGFPLRTYIGLTATDKYNPLENIAKLKEAAFGDKNAQVNTSDFIGKTVTCVVTIDNSAEFGEQNKITRFIKKSA